MAYLKIHCDVCGGTWEIYHRDNWKDDKARQCPHCMSAIDRQTWHRFVLPALGAVKDANEELYKIHAGYHAPLFSFDVVADHLYQNRNASDYSQVMNELQYIEDIILDEKSN